jgi:hypothetical protein
MTEKKIKKTYSIEVDTVKKLEELANDNKRKISNQLDIIIQDYYEAQKQK